MRDADKQLVAEWLDTHLYNIQHSQVLNVKPLEYTGITALDLEDTAWEVEEGLGIYTTGRRTKSNTPQGVRTVLKYLITSPPHVASIVFLYASTKEHIRECKDKDTREVLCELAAKLDIELLAHNIQFGRNTRLFLPVSIGMMYSSDVISYTGTADVLDKFLIYTEKLAEYIQSYTRTIHAELNYLEGR